MAEGNVQLPPNSTGQQLRTEVGDSGATSFIPGTEAQEVVTLADAIGFLPGDARQKPIVVVLANDGVLQAILGELKRISLQLAVLSGSYDDVDVAASVTTT